ncbi:MAG: hypothetical protein AAGA60_02280 [Cyanobacteria bacterium P01_E01_bin.42]
MNKHIAMWSAPRSRSTVITRAFEQIKTCMILDEPFYAPYLLTHGFDHPDREDVLSCKETNYEKIIKLITGNLPEGFSHSFQKHISKTILPEFGRDWLTQIHSFFLIRDPKEIILSYRKIYGNVTVHDVGMRELHDIFQDVCAQTGVIPLVIHSDDVVKKPARALKNLCNRLDISFSDNMLSWQPTLENSKLLFAGSLLPHAEQWYSAVMNSSGFLSYTRKEIQFPDELEPLLQECLPYYEKLRQHRVSLLE